MAHLIYKKPLLDERVRTRYIVAVKDLETLKKDGVLDRSQFASEKKKLFSETEALSKKIAGDDEDDDIKKEKKKKKRYGELDGLMGSEGSVKSGSGTGSEASTVSGSGEGKKKGFKRGTIFERNDVGRLAFKENARTEEERRALKEQRRERERLLARLQLLEMEGRALGLAVSSEDNNKIARTESTRSTSMSAASSASTKTPVKKRRNFLFFRWGSTSSAKSAENEEEEEEDEDVGDAIEIIDSYPTEDNASEDFPPTPPSPILQKRSLTDFRPPPPQSGHFPLPPNTRARSNSISHSINSSSQITFNTALHSLPRSPDALTRNGSIDHTSLGRSSPGIKRKKDRTLADFFLVPKSSSPSSEQDPIIQRALLRAASTAAAVDAEISFSGLGGTPSLRTARTGGANSLRRRRSASIISGGTGRREDVFSGFRFEFADRKRREQEVYQDPLANAPDAGPPRTNVAANPAVDIATKPLPSKPASLPPPQSARPPPRPSISQSSVSTSATSSTPRNPELRSRIMAKIKLDFFIYYQEEFKIVSKLFEYAKTSLAIPSPQGQPPYYPPSPNPSSTSSEKKGKPPAPEMVKLKVSDTINWLASHRPPTSHSSSVSTSSSKKAGDNLLDDTEIEKLKEEVQRGAWYLAAQRWLGFGRMLFSPAHHLLTIMDLDCADMVDLRILDLDPYVEAGWSWQVCYSYPQAQVFSLTTSTALHKAWLSHPHRPSNHTLLLAPPNALSPFPASFFDVISSRLLPSYMPPTTTTSPTSSPLLLPQLHPHSTSMPRSRTNSLRHPPSPTLLPQTNNNNLINLPDWPTLLPLLSTLLKPTGFLELLILEPSLDPPTRTSYPLTTAYLQKHLYGRFNPNPAAGLLRELGKATVASEGGLEGEEGERQAFRDIRKCRVWMPAIDTGDELSCVTSRLGRGLFEDAFGRFLPSSSGEGRASGEGGGGGEGGCGELWRILEGEAEERRRRGEEVGVGFRWVRCFAGKA